MNFKYFIKLRLAEYNGTIVSQKCLSTNAHLNLENDNYMSYFKFVFIKFIWINVDQEYELKNILYHSKY